MPPAPSSLARTQSLNPRLSRGVAARPLRPQPRLDPQPLGAQQPSLTWAQGGQVEFSSLGSRFSLACLWQGDLMGCLTASASP